MYDIEMVPVACIVAGINFVFTIHIRCVYIVRSLYFSIFSTCFFIRFLSPEISMPINLFLLLLLFTVDAKSSFAFSGSLLVLAVIYFSPDTVTLYVLMFLQFLNYEICMRENINWMQILLLIFWSSESCPSWMDSIALRVPT